MEEMQLTGSAAKGAPTGAAPRRGPVASTSCLVIVLLAAFIVLVVLPVSLWLLGMAYGGS